MCNAIFDATKVRTHKSIGFRKWRVSKKLLRKSLRPCGNVPTGVASKGVGVGLPQDARNGSCGPFFPFRKAWEHQRAWHRPPRNSRQGWLLCFRYASLTTVFTEPQPRCNCSEDRLRWRVRSRGASSPSESVTLPDFVSSVHLISKLESCNSGERVILPCKMTLSPLLQLSSFGLSYPCWGTSPSCCSMPIISL